MGSLERFLARLNVDEVDDDILPHRIPSFNRSVVAAASTWARDHERRRILLVAVHSEPLAVLDCRQDVRHGHPLFGNPGDRPDPDAYDVPVKRRFRDLFGHNANDPGGRRLPQSSHPADVSTAPLWSPQSTYRLRRPPDSPSARRNDPVTVLVLR
jgi:hypothetical protein